jgi:di/tricarboxylate transporter
MNLDLMITLTLLAAVVLMLALNRPRPDAVALLAMVVLPLTGVVSVPETLAGFANPNIVLIAAMFVIGDALARTGVAQRVGDWLIERGGTSELRLLVLLMTIVGVMGSVMSSTGVVAIFIPVVLRIAARSGGAPGRLMLPMAYAALISGTLTLLATSSNLVINYELISAGVPGLGFFSFTPFGLPILVLGIAYMALARRWLPSQGSDAPRGRPRPSLMDWVERYGLAEREVRLRVRSRSPLVGKTLAEVEIPALQGAQILGIQRRRLGQRVLRAGTSKALRPNDVLLADRLVAGLDGSELDGRWGLEPLPLTGAYFADRAQEVGMAEVMVPADSRLIGKSVADLHLRSEYDLTVVGLRRGRLAESHGFVDEDLELGDTLLLAGPWKGLRRLKGEGRDLVVLRLAAESKEVLPAARRAPQAIGVLLLVVGLMVFGVVPNVQAALIGCLLMGLLRCIDFQSAYRAIGWNNLIMIVGMLPFTLALERTGGVDLAADALITLIGDAGPRVMLASLFGITVLLGLFIVNTANAVLIAPVALAIAEDLGASPYPFAMTVALAASAAFMTPISPVNGLVATPGNYGFGDFIRFGLPLTLLTLGVAVILVPWLLPLY